MFKNIFIVGYIIMYDAVRPTVFFVWVIEY